MASATQRLAGLTGALIVQVGLVSLFWYTSAPMGQRLPPPRELLLMLRARPKPPPVPMLIDARPGITAPRPTVAPPPQSTAPVQIVPPSRLQDFGRSLFGCAPENYANLSAEDRARCPKPGEGLALMPDRDLLTEPKSLAKDEALWKEQMAQKNWMPGPCSPSGQESVMACLMRQTREENRRSASAMARIAEERAARMAEPKRAAPANVRYRGPQK